MTKLTKQMVVVEQPAIQEHQQTEAVALFSPDGSPYSSPGGGASAELIVEGLSSINTVLDQDGDIPIDAASNVIVLPAGVRFLVTFLFTITCLDDGEEDESISLSLNHLFRNFELFADNSWVFSGVLDCQASMSELDSGEICGTFRPPSDTGSTYRLFDLSGQLIKTQLRESDRLYVTGTVIVYED